MGSQALATLLAADLHDHLPLNITDELWQRALGLTPEPAAPYVGPLNQQPIPGSAQDLLRELAPVVIAHPSDTGLNIGLLLLLAELWPHVSGEERPLLRVRFLNGVMERAASIGTRSGVPREAVVTTSELKVWNRYMPTATGDDPSAALQQLLTAPTAQEAYHQLANHLTGGMSTPILARIIGTLALQLADQRADAAGHQLHAVVGAVAAERLARAAPPDAMATLLAQLAHQLWWLANGADLAPRRDDGGAADDLATAITSGAASAARTHARRRQLDETAWWLTLGPVACQLAAQTPEHLRRTIAAMWILAARSEHHVVAPDDAAAVTALLADGFAAR
jgi:hypothetical protein